MPVILKIESFANRAPAIPRHLARALQLQSHVNAICPQIPENAPFDPVQRQWINGYLAGLFSGRAQAETPRATLGPLLFLWGTQTGGAESLARKFAKDAVARGFDAKAMGLDASTPADLTLQSRACIITSTYGDGEMPDNAQSFWEALASDEAPRLENLSFSVLALGDRNYTQFCRAGLLFDERLAALGAKRVLPRVDCDVDEETKGHQWFANLMTVLAPGSVADASPSGENNNSHNKSRPYQAKLKTNRLLTGEGSAKETRHFEIVLDGSGLEYEVGDALGVIPTNCPDFVAEILSSAGLDGSETVTLKDGSTATVRDALVSKFDLAPFIAKLPEPVAASDLVAPLRPLQHRLYSISSSPKAHPGEVHLTVGIVRYELDGKPRKGACSTFLADRADGTVPVFIHKSPGFRLPAEGKTPVIMIGPGTGIAPFRAFLEERRATAPDSRNWLFFGDQHAGSDFLYQEELGEMFAEGVLTQLDTAFSRDQERKIYVQDRMHEKAATLWAWIEEGAHLYVCGDAKRMAKDVDEMLHRIIAEQGGLTAEEAKAYVGRLKTAKRYQRDVY
jgi:sulfite reductase (NADPH) flavoprotein alpha-component